MKNVIIKAIILTINNIQWMRTYIYNALISWLRKDEMVQYKSLVMYNRIDKFESYVIKTYGENKCKIKKFSNDQFTIIKEETNIVTIKIDTIWRQSIGSEVVIDDVITIRSQVTRSGNFNQIKMEVDSKVSNIDIVKKQNGKYNLQIVKGNDCIIVDQEMYYTTIEFQDYQIVQEESEEIVGIVVEIKINDNLINNIEIGMPIIISGQILIITWVRINGENMRATIIANLPYNGTMYQTVCIL